MEHRKIRSAARAAAACAAVALALASSPSVAHASVQGVTTLSGTTEGQPYVENETASSRRFRIPALITLDNGWILSAADARWGSTMDSASNLDGLVSVSKDGGETWEWELVNHLDDYADQTVGAYRPSASFIDPALVQGDDGTVYMIADAFPAYCGLQNGGSCATDSTGFDDEGNLLIGKGTAGDSGSTDADDYVYHVDRSASVQATVDGAGRTLYPIVENDTGDETGMYVDGELDLYEKSGDSFSAYLVSQYDENGSLDENTKVQGNVMYAQSEWKVYPTSYIALRAGTVTDNGIEWGELQLLDIKVDGRGEGFAGVCPGRGISVTLDDGTNRIIFPIYNSGSGWTETASVIYSDDGGKTWQRGGLANDFNGTGKSSESQIVELPDGTLRMFSRNSVGYISYTDSTDYGETWGTYQTDESLAYVGNCMVSFINVDGYAIAPDGTVYGNLIMASYPQGSGRNNGVLRVGSVDATTNEITWLNDDDIDYAGSYLYSCLTQIDGDRIGLLYEKEDTEWGSGHIVYEEVSVSGALGDGWAYSADPVPTLSVSVDEQNISVGSTTQLSLAMEGDGTAGTVAWSVASDAGDEIASLDKSETAVGESVTLTAEGTGKVTVTATTTVTLPTGASVGLSASARVYISDSSTTTLPDEYDANELVEETSSLTSPWYLLTAEEDAADAAVADGTYVIYASNGGRLLYFASGSSSSDQVTPSLSDDGAELTPDSGYALTRQTWKIARTDQGYTIESCDAPGYYLNINGTHSSKLPVSTTPTYFDITVNADGSCSISTEVDGTTYYLSHPDGTGQFSASPTAFIGLRLFEQGTKHTISADGLSKLVQDVQALDSEQYLGWDDVEAALETASDVLAQYDGATFKNDADAAQTAFSAVETATTDLYRAVLALVDRDDAVYTVTYQITGDYFADDAYAVQEYHRGESVSAPEDPSHEGYTFSGWQGVPETMPEENVVVTGSFTKDEQTGGGDTGDTGDTGDSGDTGDAGDSGQDGGTSDDGQQGGSDQGGSDGSAGSDGDRTGGSTGSGSDSDSYNGGSNGGSGKGNADAGGLPQTGDPAVLAAALAVASCGAVGAGVAIKKRMR